MRRFLPLALVAVAFTAWTIVWIVTDRRAAQRVYDEYSSANTSKSGMSLAAGYLARHHEVNILTVPFARARLERDAVVFRIARELPRVFDTEQLGEDESGPPKPLERPLLGDAEEAFVRRGGRMILAAEAGLLDQTSVDGQTAVKVFPMWRGVRTLDAGEASSAFLSLRPRMHAIFTLGPNVLLAHERIGEGELFVLSAPQILRNENLANADHLALVAELAGTGRPVYFDEVLHGIMSDDGVLAVMKEWNLGPFLALLAVAALLVFWRQGRRIGPADEDDRDVRSDAIDLVQSLGALYRDVTSDGEAIALYHDALVRTVAHKTGLRGDALQTRIGQLTGNFAPRAGGGRMPASVFARQLKILNDAFRST